MLGRIKSFLSVEDGGVTGWAVAVAVIAVTAFVMYFGILREVFEGAGQGTRVANDDGVFFWFTGNPFWLFFH